MSVPGVITPPLAMIFTTRGAALGTLADRPAQVLLSRGLPAHRPAVAAGRGDRRPRADDGGPVRAETIGADAVEHRPPVVAEVADRGHPGAQVLLLGGDDDAFQLVGGELGNLVERAEAAVAAQVDMGVDQPGQERRAGDVDDLAPVRGGCGGRLHADDAPFVDQDEDAAGHGAGSVEGPVGSVRAHQGPPLGGRCLRAG